MSVIHEPSQSSLNNLLSKEVIGPIPLKIRQRKAVYL